MLLMLLLVPLHVVLILLLRPVLLPLLLLLLLTSTLRQFARAHSLFVKVSQATDGDGERLNLDVLLDALDGALLLLPLLLLPLLLLPVCCGCCSCLGVCSC